MEDTQQLLATQLHARYAVERELGAGATATVYLARSLTDERRVAIKVLREELSASVSVDRFQREVRIATTLRHPHIVGVLESGTVIGDQGITRPFVVMPFIDGETLRARLTRERTLAVDEAVRLAREIGEGLAHAHAQGVVHRDVKPENVLIEQDHALVADFGIARALDQAAGGGERLTRTGVAVGTPTYMSPERWLDPQRIDARGDIYAVGCLLYEMLVGEPPYTGPTTQVVMARHSMAPIPSIRVARSTVPESIERAVARALAKDPSDRFRTMRDFIAALDPAAAPESAATGATRGAGSIRRWRLVGGSVLAVALAIGAFALVTRGTTRARALPLAATRVVVATLENRTGDPALDAVGAMAADWITNGLQQTRLIDVVPSPTAVAATRFLRTELAAGRARDPVRVLAAETGAGLVVTGGYYRLGDSLSFQIEAADARTGKSLGGLLPVVVAAVSPDRAIDPLRERVLGLLAVNVDDRLRAQASVEIHPPTFASYRAFSDGLDRYVENQYRGALPFFERASALDSSFVVPLLYAALSHTNLNEWAAADSIARIVERMRERLSEYHASWLDYVDGQVAGDHERARRAITRAAEMAPGTKASYNLARVDLQLNRPAEAKRALESLDPEKGAMRGWYQYWDLYCDALHRLSAHRLELRAARNARRLHPDELDARRLEAEALVGLGEVRSAIAVVDSALARPDAPSAGLARLVYRTGVELRTHGDTAEARAVFDKGIQWLRAAVQAKRSGVDGDALDLELRGWLAALYDDAQQWADAEREMQILARARPADVGYRAFLGKLAARRNDRRTATATSEWLATADARYDFGLHLLQRARIAAALGARDDAIALLRDAYAQGQPIPRHPDGNFIAWRGYASFDALMRRRD